MKFVKESLDLGGLANQHSLTSKILGLNHLNKHRLHFNDLVTTIRDNYVRPLLGLLTVSTWGFRIVICSKDIDQGYVDIGASSVYHRYLCSVYINDTAICFSPDSKPSRFYFPEYLKVGDLLQVSYKVWWKGLDDVI